MNKETIKCSVCKEETEFNYGAIIKGRGYVKGHRSCISPLLDQFSYKKFCWHDGKGGYTKGWLDDVKRRRVVAGGEVIRDYGKKYSFGG